MKLALTFGGKRGMADSLFAPIESQGGPAMCILCFTAPLPACLHYAINVKGTDSPMRWPEGRLAIQQGKNSARCCVRFGLELYLRLAVPRVLFLGRIKALWAPRSLT